MELQPAAAVAEVVGTEVGVAEQEEMELMVLLVFLMGQPEQADLAFHSRFLATMGEIPKCMARVEMAEQIGPLVLQLEQTVWQIEVMAAQEEVPCPAAHHTLAASLKWVEMAVPVWS